LENSDYRSNAGLIFNHFGIIAEREQLFCFEKHFCRKK